MLVDDGDQHDPLRLGVVHGRKELAARRVARRREATGVAVAQEAVVYGRVGVDEAARRGWCCCCVGTGPSRPYTTAAALNKHAGSIIVAVDVVCGGGVVVALGINASSLASRSGSTVVANLDHPFLLVVVVALHRLLLLLLLLLLPLKLLELQVQLLLLQPLSRTGVSDVSSSVAVHRH